MNETEMFSRIGAKVSSTTVSSVAETADAPLFSIVNSWVTVPLSATCVGSSDFTMDKIGSSENTVFDVPEMSPTSPLPVRAAVFVML